MGYNWKGMRKLSWDEVKEYIRKGYIVGCFRLYEDGTEGMIEREYDLDDLIQHHEAGGEFGEELRTVNVSLPDGKAIKVPEYVDLSQLGCLDSLEYEMWHTIQQYLEYFGITMTDDEPDWATVKGVQDKIIEILTEAGVEFKFE